MNPYTGHYYAELATGSRRSALHVLSHVKQRDDFASVADFGCGSGEWLAILPELGVTDYRGVDGDWSPCAGQPWFKVADLREPVDLGRRFDLTVSVEVAEHLPFYAAETYVDTLCRHSDAIVFSAGIPYQVGTDHINLQWPTFWSGLFRKRGYHCSDRLRLALWENKDIEWWYRQNLLYVTKGAPGPDPMRLVHPDLLHAVATNRGCT